MAEKSILFDATKCIACRACQVACKQWNDLPAETTSNRGTYENPPDLSPSTWMKMSFVETSSPGKVDWLFTRRACMHCTEAACVKVCPTKAVYHNALGMVSYNKELCSGCGYCVDNCPFHVPKTDRNLITGIALMDKCTMCTSTGLDRVSAGYEPACVKTCPPQALTYGDRSALVTDGRNRIIALRSQGFKNAYLYGEKELGGLHVMYVLSDSPAVYGLPVDPQVPVTAAIWKSGLQPIGLALGGLTAVGLCLNYLVARKTKLAAEAVAAAKEEK